MGEAVVVDEESYVIGIGVQVRGGARRGRGGPRLASVLSAVLAGALLPVLAVPGAQAAPAAGPEAQHVSPVVRSAEQGKPGAPRLFDIFGDARRLAIDYVPPGSDGGHTIQRYESTLDGGKTWKKLAEYDDGDDGLIGYRYHLKVNKKYKVAVRAVNSAGHSKKFEVRSIRAVDAPSKPRKVKVSVTGESVSVSWKAPKSDGGRPVVDYNVVADTGQADVLYGGCLVPVSGASRRCTLTGLVSGQSYVVRIQADNTVDQPYEASPQVIGDGLSDTTLSLPFTAP